MQTKQHNPGRQNNTIQVDKTTQVRHKIKTTISFCCKNFLSKLKECVTFSKDLLIVIFSSEYKDFIKGDYSRREAGRACWKEMEVKIQKLFNKIIPEVFQDEKTRRKYYNSSMLQFYLQKYC